MEIYVLNKKNLEILTVSKIIDYEINLDEETNAKTIINMKYDTSLKNGNYIVLNGLYKQFLFVIENVQKEKNNNIATVTALDISNIFNRKVIEKNLQIMDSDGLEDFISTTIADFFVLSDDNVLNLDYIDIYIHSHTQKKENTNSQNFIYNFHVFLINCRQNSNIYTDFKFENGRLRIDIENKIQNEVKIDTTLAEVTDYKKIFENKITAKVSCYCRDTENIYNLYLKTDRKTTTDKNDPIRADGEVEIISIEKESEAYNECLNVIKGNSYKHLVEFKISKLSKLIDVTELKIGTLVQIKTEDDIYDSYISAITIKDENFIYYKTGNIRTNLIDKLKKSSGGTGNKLDAAGGNVTGELTVQGKKVATDAVKTTDTNGWKILNYGTHKEWVKKGSFSYTLDGYGWNSPGLIRIPTELSILGENILTCSLASSDSAISLCGTCSENSSCFYFHATNCYGGSVTFTIYYQIRILEV